MSFFSSGNSSHGGLFSSGVGSPVGATASLPVSKGNPNAPRCYRCGGTVEGPKYSTCKCSIPAMTPLEPAAADGVSDGAAHESRRGSMGNLMGMLSFGMMKGGPNSSSHGSFHGALQLDETKPDDVAPTAAPSAAAIGGNSLLFLEVEDSGDSNIKTRGEESHDLLGLGADSYVTTQLSHEEATHNDLQADI